MEKGIRRFERPFLRKSLKFVAKSLRSKHRILVKKTLFFSYAFDCTTDIVDVCSFSRSFYKNIVKTLLKFQFSVWISKYTSNKELYLHLHLKNSFKSIIFCPEYYLCFKFILPSQQEFSQNGVSDFCRKTNTRFDWFLSYSSILKANQVSYSSEFVIRQKFQDHQQAPFIKSQRKVLKTKN